MASAVVETHYQPLPKTLIRDNLKDSKNSALIIW